MYASWQLAHTCYLICMFHARPYICIVSRLHTRTPQAVLIRTGNEMRSKCVLLRAIRDPRIRGKIQQYLMHPGLGRLLTSAADVTLLSFFWLLIVENVFTMAILEAVKARSYQLNNHAVTATVDGASRPKPRPRLCKLRATSVASRAFLVFQDSVYEVSIPFRSILQ